MIPRVHWIVILVIFALGLAISAVLWHRLPEPSPVHWDLQGKVDGWGPRWQVAWLLPPLALAVVVLMAFLPWLGPFRRNMESFQVTYGRILVLVMGIFLAMHTIFLLNAAGFAVPVGRAMAVVVGILLAILGNWMGKLRRNFYVGIRTPWTIANEEVWERTHRVSGPLFVLHGIVTALFGIFGSNVLCFVVLLGGLIAISGFAVVYSLVLYRQLGSVDELTTRETN